MAVTAHFSSVQLFQFQPKPVQGLTINQSALAQFEGGQFSAFEVLVDVVLTNAELLGRLSR